MRIISKFHDYYDAVLAEGQDRSLVFVRERIEFDLTPWKSPKELPAPLKSFKEMAEAALPRSFESRKPSKLHSSIDVRFGLLAFVGVLHPFAVVNRPLKTGLVAASDTIVYDKAELEAILAEHDISLTERDQRIRSRWNFRGVDERVSTFFELSGSDRLVPHCTEHVLPILNFSAAPSFLTVNPSLKDLQFFRKMDAWQAFQELSMFMGNIAAPDRVPVTISDKDRVIQHGFDGWSFKKRPQALR